MACPEPEQGVLGPPAHDACALLCNGLLYNALLGSIQRKRHDAVIGHRVVEKPTTR